MTTQFNLSENGCLIFDQLPEGTLVGIDCHSWNVGPRFKGISNIPPGFHLLFFNPTDKYANYSTRTGVFLFVKKGDIVTKVYDQRSEDINEAIDLHVRKYYIEKINELAANLAPYRTEELSTWTALTTYVTETMAYKVQPCSGKLTMLTNVPLTLSGYQMRDAFDFDSRIKHTEDYENQIRFTAIPKSIPKNIKPTEKTKLFTDASYFLEKFFTQYGEKDILGELQLAFICFFLAHVYDAFDHWKALISLMTSCLDLLSQKPDFFMQFIDVVDTQLQEVSVDFFLDTAAQNNILAKKFQHFFDNIALSNVEKLQHKGSILKGRLTERFGWDFDAEDEECMPVIVDL